MHPSTKALLAEIAVMRVVLTTLGFAGYPLFLPYQWHKLLHVFGSVIFLLGNAIVTGVWMVLAERNKKSGPRTLPQKL
ncbi:MAG: hypothetical protein N3C12_09725 [Candidatus Binatia bacterium]|nr:hypothetical protein [Candidatus Binatia bacterium]